MKRATENDRDERARKRSNAKVTPSSSSSSSDPWSSLQLRPVDQWTSSLVFDLECSIFRELICMQNETSVLKGVGLVSKYFRQLLLDVLRDAIAIGFDFSQAVYDDNTQNPLALPMCRASMISLLAKTKIVPLLWWKLELLPLKHAVGKDPLYLQNELSKKRTLTRCLKQHGFAFCIFFLHPHLRALFWRVVMRLRPHPKNEHLLLEIKYCC
jgi:hypothetical protein